MRGPPREGRPSHAGRMRANDRISPFSMTDFGFVWLCFGLCLEVTNTSRRVGHAACLCSTRDANATLYVVWPVLGEQHPSSADEEHT